MKEANLRLGELNAFSTFVPDVDVFSRMHIVKEATQSSRIEGTRTLIDEAVLEAKDISPELKDDWQEVQNYIEAMNHSLKSPIFPTAKRSAQNFIKRGRGKNKVPGEFRTNQNWIGGATINDAIFVPPHHTLVPDVLAIRKNF